jgi:DNA repair protein RecO (recombination protein O)
MLQKTSGIVLHTTNYSETSLIVKIYTSNFGLQSYIISGVRSKKSKNKAVLFQPLALVEMIVSGSEKNNLQRISEISIEHPYSTIPYHIIKSTIAIFINEILYRSIKEEHADMDMFEYIKNSLLLLDLKTDNLSDFHIRFMLQLSRYLGFYPQGKYSAETPIFDLQEGRFVKHIPGHSHYLNTAHSLLLNDFIITGNDQLKLTKLQRKELLQTLILFYRLHIASFGEIKSHTVLEEVMLGP